MKKIIVVFIFIFCFSLSANANEIYEEFYNASGMEAVYENTPEAVLDFFEENNLSPSSPDFMSELSAKNLFSLLLSYIKNGANSFLGVICASIAILLLWALYSCFSKEITGGVTTAFTIILALNLCAPIISLITASSAAIKSGGVFMLSFLPVFFGVSAATGAVQTAATGGTTLLLAAEITVQIIAFAVIPVASAQLALTISGVFAEISPAYKLAEALKKASAFLLTLTFTVFLGLLSVQTTIGASADSLTLKTTKFMVGSFIPVTGTALSETISTLGGSIKILQNGIGVYGIVVVLLTVLPTAAAILVWRITLFISKATAELLALPSAAKLITAAEDSLSLLLGVLLFVGALFIISLSILLKVSVI